VIYYVAVMEDPEKITQQTLKSIPDPVTRDSACGYLIALTAERLRTFKKIDGNVPQIGQQITVFLGGSSTVTGAVEGYVEQWQGDPIVGIALLARIQAKDQTRFKNNRSGYLLVSANAQPVSPQTIADPSAGVQYKSTEVLNRFGTLGDLIERTAEAGLDIRLFRSERGALRPTGVAAGCGD